MLKKKLNKVCHSQATIEHKSLTIKFQAILEFMLREGTLIHPSSNDKKLWGIGNSMSMVLDTKKFLFGSQHWLQFPISFIMTFYYRQNPTDIVTKCFSFLIVECVRFLLQNAKVLLQNATFITKSVGTLANVL